MIRNDFVSNSSSTSYIIAVGSNYPINTFIKDICKNCINKKSKYHIKDLLDRNITSLSYHIQNTRLLFLGEAFVCDREYIIDRTKKKEWESKEEHESSFDNLFKRIKKKSKDGKFDEYDQTYEILSDTQIKAIDHIWESSLSFGDRNDMNFEIIHSEKNPEFEEKHNKQTVKNIQELLKYKNQRTRFWMDDSYFHNTYVIDQSTIDRTKLMQKYGIQMRFSKWENLKKIEKLLKEGNTIIAMRVAHSGDGMEPDYIYNERDDNDVFENIPVQFLNSEIE